ncbi:MAG: hypothetical protein ABSA70_07535, partial [Terriglobia bacterium]
MRGSRPAEIRQRLAAGSELHPVPGTLTFVDNTVDNTTGTIRLKGTFANPERRLWPGQFVNAVLKLTQRPNAIVVPSQAVQTGQSGQYVFVIKPDLTAESRQPLGLAVVGGLLVSQLITLNITPVYYTYLESFQQWIRRISRSSRAAVPSEIPAEVSANSE